MSLFRLLHPACLSIAPLVMALFLCGCSKEGDGPVVVSVIGSDADFAKPLQKLPDPGAKLMLEATAQGLVAFDAGGDILPALAQRWIVEDDGKSYIFRLHRAFWANGTRVTAPDVARILLARVEALRRLDPEGPLDAVQAIIPMTGEVIEIRLAAPRPYVLQMLAQPQMAILSRDGGTGPYRRLPRGSATLLAPIDHSGGEDDDAPLPERETRIVRAERASLAIVRFRAGRAALVLGGRFTDLPLLVRANIDRNLVRIDPVQGMLGLLIVGRGALLDSPDVRAAINMAIDRSTLPGLFPLGGWTTTDHILPDQLDLGRPPTDPAWSGMAMPDRLTQARTIIENWREANDASPPPLRIALPPGAGATLLFGLLQRDLAAIGLQVERVAPDANTDLRIVDEVAAYDSALWYLGRIGCAWTPHCSREAQAALQQASLAGTTEDRMARIAQAEALIVANNSFIPLGAPIRWSLASRRLDGFLPSPRARHPLNRLLRDTN